MEIVVFGGTGRTGRLIARRLIKLGHTVAVAGRNDPRIEGVRFVRSDLMQTEDVRAAVEGADAAISALASGKGNPVCSGVARALVQGPDLRFITIGGAGVDVPGDQKGPGDKLVGWVMRRIVPDMIADRQAEHDILQASRLRWTMLRAPRLTDNAGTGTTRLTFDRPASTSISRADLAMATIEALDNASLIGRAPFVAQAKT